MSLPSKVMSLIEVLLETEDSMGIRELAMKTDIPKSTVQRILDSLGEKRLGFSGREDPELPYRLQVSQHDERVEASS